MFNNKGFTLIELLVVVLIIGILAAIAVPQYKKSVMKTKYNALKINVRAIINAEKVYYLANSKYTNDLNELDISISNNENVTCRMGVETNQAICADSSISMQYQERFNPANNKTYFICYTPVKDLNSPQAQICQEETGRITPDYDTESYYAWTYL